MLNQQTMSILHSLKLLSMAKGWKKDLPILDMPSFPIKNLWDY